MDMSQYLEVFIEESKEYLQILNKCLLQLEKNPEDCSTINEIFRAAHTIKGMSGTMGFTRMAKLTHNMENVLSLLRSNEIIASSPLIDIMFKCLDAVEDYLEKISSTASEGTDEYNDLIAELNLINSDPLKGNASPQYSQKTKDIKQSNIPMEDQLTIESSAAQKACASGVTAFKIAITLNKDCMLKSARAFVIFQLLGKISDIIDSVPKFKDIENENFDRNFIVFITTKNSEKFLMDELKAASEVGKIEIEEIIPASGQARSEKSTEIGSKKNLDDCTATEYENGTKKKAIAGRTARIEVEKLDSLMNLVGELIITKTRLQSLDISNSNKDYKDTIEYLERVSTNLNDAVMKIRMVPIDTVFSRLPRMIRDISRELGKDIILTMAGQDTELDRMVVDEIGDPLVHLIRNATDHGIETPAERIKSGKTREGHISLKAYRDGNSVIIDLEDDGVGIDIEKVKSKAVKSGLINEEIAKNLAEKDITDFIFLPNFSTTTKITGISGRGVGLDVVKTKIESLNGTVEVQTKFGKGSRFKIKLPMTLSIIQALLVVCGSEKYAIPISTIQSIERIYTEDLKIVQKREVMILRDTVIPVVRLDKVLDVTGHEDDKKRMTVVIVRKNDKLSGIAVDSIIGQYEMVIKSLGKLLSGINVIAGATILGDGKVALILDVNSLV